jgi:tetratricopeptide (TPR) repeat protein
MAYTKTPADLRSDLLEQIDFLRASCAAYDAGRVSEAKRMAVALRILLHDRGKNTRSLLTQLDIKESLSYHSIVSRPKGPSVMLLNFTMNFSPEGVSFSPKLSEAIDSFPFDEWWNQLIFVNHGISMSRSDIALSVSDTDGGAHIDPTLKGNYSEMAKNNGIGLTKIPRGISTSKEGEPIDGKHELLFIRQISNELLNTFDEQLAKVFASIDQGGSSVFFNIEAQRILSITNVAEQRTELEKLGRIRENNYYFLMIKAQVYINEKNYESAKACYLRIIETYQGAWDAQAKLADFLRSYERNYLESYKYYELSLDKNPDAEETLVNFAVLLKEQFNDPERAKQYYEKACSISPLVKAPHRDAFFGL